MKKLHFIILFALVLTACQGNKLQKVSDSNIQTVETESTIAVTSPDIEVALPQEEKDGDVDDISAKSLNDVRFNGWIDADWLDNDYIRTLRKYIDAYCRGEIKNSDLDQYKSIMQSKFVVLNIEPFISGGTFITIVFLDNPQCVFNSWVYSEVNSNNQVVDYIAKGLRLVDTEYPMTKEEILEIIKEHPEHKLW